MKTTLKKALCLLAALMLAAFAVSCTSAKVTEAIMTDSVDADGVPGEAVASFPGDAEIIYSAAKLLNAPDNTQVRVLWTYQSEDRVMDEVTIDSGDIANRYIYSSFEPAGILPEGDYKVEFFVEDRDEPDATAMFLVTAPSVRISDAFMTLSVDENGLAGEAVESFSADAEMLYTFATLEEAKQRTQVRIVWTYITGDQLIDEVTVGEIDPSDPTVYSILQPTEVLPAGDYQVAFYLNGSEEAAYTVPFTVANTTPVITDAHMTSYMEAGGVPADTITVLEPTGTWYVSAILTNTQPDTQIRYEWYDTTGGVIDAYTFDPQGQSDIYIGGTLSLTAIAPEGTYQVAIFIEGEADPAAVVEFEVKGVDQSTAADPSGFLTYTQQEGGFTISYPSDWTLVAQPDSLAAGFYASGYEINGMPDDNAVMVVTVRDDAAGYTIEEALAEWVTATDNEGRDDYVNIDSDVEDVNGRDMGMFAYSWSYEGQALYTFDFLVIKGDDLYIITSTFRAEDAQTLYPYLEQMVLSFKVL